MFTTKLELVSLALYKFIQRSLEVRRDIVSQTLHAGRGRAHCIMATRTFPSARLHIALDTSAVCRLRRWSDRESSLENKQTVRNTEVIFEAWHDP